MDIPNTPPVPTPETSLTTAPEYTADETRAGLEKLRAELAAPERAGDLMKKFEAHKVDTTDWKKDPKLAIPAIEKHLPESQEKDILLAALKSDDKDPVFDIGRQAVISLSESIGNRRKEIEKAKVALSDLNENALNKWAKDGVVNLYRGIKRGDVTDILIAGTALAVLASHIFTKDDKNRLLRPLAFATLGFFGLNSLVLHFSKKSATDRLDAAGAPYLPSARKELPEQMQALAKFADIEQSSELVALGRLGNLPMSQVYSYYDPSKKIIEPHKLGFSPDEITGEALYRIVDTMVKKHDERSDGRQRVGTSGDFEKDFVKKHDYTFLEVNYLLYEKDINRALTESFTPEERKALNERMELDTKRMFENVPGIVPKLEHGMISFYGIKFHGDVPKGQEPSIWDKEPTSRLGKMAHSAKSSVMGDTPREYIFKLGNDRSITLKTGEGPEKRRDQARILEQYAREYVLETIKEQFPTSPALDGHLEFNRTTHTWEFRDVFLKGNAYTVGIIDTPEQKLVAKVNGKTTADWSKLEEQV